MAVQVLVVVFGLVIALSVGMVAGMPEGGAPFLGWLIIGMLPGLSGLLYVAERMIGREIWQYTAPYPHRRMGVAVVAGASHRETAPEGERTGADAEDIQVAA